MEKQTMTTEKAVGLTLAALRTERLPLAARVDAIDLAIDNLSRVYGISGTPQPLPLERSRVKRRGRKQKARGRPGPKAAKRGARRARPARSEGSEARRAELLTIIGRAEHGLTISELRAATPKMDGGDRSQDLQALKLAGKIHRAGNSWRAAA